jgi:hypothetical protein
MIALHLGGSRTWLRERYHPNQQASVALGFGSGPLQKCRVEREPGTLPTLVACLRA